MEEWHKVVKLEEEKFCVFPYGLSAEIILNQSIKSF